MLGDRAIRSQGGGDNRRRCESVRSGGLAIPCIAPDAMIMIVAPRDDFHAFVARHMLREDFGADCEVLELAAFPHKAQLSLEIHSGGHRVKHRADQHVDWSDVSTVWWRRPQLHFASEDDRSEDPQAVEFALRECSSLVTTLFNEDSPRVINRPHRQQLAACKGTQLLHAKRLSIQVPDTLITNSREDIEAFRARNHNCVFKVLTWTGTRLIPTRTLTDADLEYADALRFAPVIVQEQLPAGLDIRVNIFGAEVYSAAKQVETVDGRLDPRIWQDHLLPDSLSQKLLGLLRVLGLDYGCIDLRLLPDGRYFFFEVNPSGQFLMVERDTKQPLTRSLCRLLTA